MMIHRIAGSAVAVVALSAAGCASKTRTAVAATSAAPAVCSAPDTAGLGPDPWAVTFAGPLRPLLDSLDKQVAAASPDKLPELLLARGRAKLVYQPDDSAYAKSKPDEYLYNEVGADWLYTGKDFRELIRRFPSSPLVDDAAYELTRLPAGGECEDSTACMVGVGWMPVAEFLRAHPRARQADWAAARALEAFRGIDSGRDLRLGNAQDAPDAIRNMVAELDTIARLQVPPRSTRLLMRAAELWESLGDYDQSVAAYKAALAIGDSTSGRCIAERLADMPTTGFSLDTARVITPRRVELRWQPPPGAAGTGAVYRSYFRSDTGKIVARVGLSDKIWTDTTTLPDTTYWYRLAVDAPGPRMRSNPTSATTPPWRVEVRRIAVSIADRRLYLFGSLANGFQQVLSVAPDGASIERYDGTVLGIYPARPAFGAYTDDVWIVDAGGAGVLRFHKSGPELPASLYAALRQGSGLLRAQPATEPADLLASVDERHGAAWLAYHGNITAMDCAGAPSVCWNGGESEALLRDDSGVVRATVHLPRDEREGNEFATAVFAEPDSSAWLWLDRSRRLWHVSHTGATLGELQIGKPNWPFGPALAIDRDGHALWFTQVEPVGGVCGTPSQCRTELVRLDTRSTPLQPRVMATITPFTMGSVLLAPDLSGGVWVVVDQVVRRIDATGRTLFTTTLEKR